MQTRDLQQIQQSKLDQKRDIGQVVRAVIVEVNGSIWSNESERRLWYLPQGATQPGQVICIRDVRPQVDLPVLVGKAEGSDILEVLSVDPFVMVNAQNLPPQIVDHHKSHEPGGRDVMNLYPKQLVPFQVYYAGTSLRVNVVAGYCEIDGQAIRFKGKINYDLSSEQPSSGNVNYVGLYVDNAGSLQTITGATVADTVTNIPEPAWPASVIRLCVVKLNGDQTSIAYDDIIYRNRLYTTITSGTGFPFALISVDLDNPNADYDNFTAANAAAGTGDVVFIGPGEYSLGKLTLKAATYIGLGPNATHLMGTVPASTTGNLLTLPDGCHLENLHIDFQATDISGVLSNDGNEVSLKNCRVTATQTASGALVGMYTVNSATTRLDNVDFEIDAGSSQSEAVRVYQSLLNAYNCIFNAISTGTGYDVAAFDATAIINLYDAQLVNGTINNTGQVKGTYEYFGKRYDLYLKSYLYGYRFSANTATYPAGWTEVTAPSSTDQNKEHSFWYLQGAPANTTWQYRRQTGVNLESSISSYWQSFMFGPFLFRDGGYSANVDYYFALHSDGAGVPGAAYIRTRLTWNSGSGVWQIRGEEHDGSAAHTSTYVNLSVPLAQPLYLRVLARNDTAKTTRAYWGTSPNPDSHSLLLSQVPTTPPTWGNMWLQITRTRGAGVEDYSYLQAIDFLEQTP